MAQRGAVSAGQAIGTVTLPSLIRQHAALRPAAPAIVTVGAAPLDYRGLLQRSDALGRLLRQAGIGRDGRVGVMLPSGSALASALVGVFSHAVAVPLDPRLTAAELEDLRTRARLDAILTDSAGRLPTNRPARSLPFEAGGEPLELLVYGPRGGRAEERSETLECLAMILRTSGTTALPKLVALSHGNMAARAERLRTWLHLSEADRALCFVPLYYAHGLETALFAPLAVGGSLACPPSAEPGGPAGDVLAWLAELEPTYYSAGPTFQRMILDRAQAAPAGGLRHRLRLIQGGGAPLPAPEQAAIEAVFGVPVLEAYGLSESGQLASNAWAADERRAGTVGRPVPGTVALRAEDGTVVPAESAGAGAAGEILGRGPVLTPGYLDDDGRPRTVLQDGWFPTGDIGAIDADGFLTVTGRLKDIVNRGGEKISPAEVDRALLHHPEVSQAAAFAVAHPRLGEDLAAAVVLRPGATVTALQLRRFLADRLVPFKVPRRIHLVPELPKGATGKVNRSALRGLFAAREQRVQVRSTLEFEITRLWARLLGRESVDPSADFFELGGDSLLAVEMRLALEQLTGREVPEGLLFEAATARQLANAIIADDLGPDRTLLPLRATGSKAPLFFFDGDLGGGGYYMRRVATWLDPERPLWLLRPFELERGRLPPIEAMAAHYLSLLRAAGIRPPYRFGGHCNGALLALEAARQAEAAGEAVEVVILVDPISLNARPPLRAAQRVLSFVGRLRSRQARKRYERLGAAMARVWKFAEWLPSRSAVVPDLPLAVPGADEAEAAFERRHEQRMAIYRQAMACYLPRRIAGRLVCLTAERSWPPYLYAAAPWARFAGRFETSTIPGGHLTCLTDGAEALAARLNAVLQDG